MKKIRYFAAATACLLAGLFLTTRPSPATAQSGSRAGQSAQKFETRMWQWLARSKYQQWAHPQGQNGDFYPGKSPHGMFLKMYLNSTAAADQGHFPQGSVIVKENFSPDKKLMSVTVMYRTKKYDPEHGNWWWAKYMPNGMIAKAPPEKGSMRLVGKVKPCIMCHSGADGDDMVFTNDK